MQKKFAVSGKNAQLEIRVFRGKMAEMCLKSMVLAIFTPDASRKIKFQFPDFKQLF